MPPRPLPHLAAGGESTMDQMPPSQNDFILAAIAAAASQDPGGFLGPLIMSAFVCIFFSGLLAIQGATYFRCFPNDNRWLKGLVGGTLLLSIVQAVSWIYLSWKWFVVGFGDWAGLFIISGTFASEPIVSQLTISFAQAFFIYRAHILTQRNRVLVAFLVLGILASLALFIAYCVDLIANPYNFPYRRFILIAALSITIATDTVITGVTTWKLLTSRRGVNPSTDNGLSKLLQVTWEAAVPPAIAAIANLIVVLGTGSNLLYIFLNILVPRLYVFSLMFTLNSRPEVRRVFESSQAKWPSTLSSSSDRSKQARPVTTTRIMFAPVHSGATENTNALSTLARVEIAEDVHESDGYELDDLSMPLPSGIKADDISDFRTISTIEDEQKTHSLPSLSISHFA